MTAVKVSKSSAYGNVLSHYAVLGYGHSKTLSPPGDTYDPVGGCAEMSYQPIVKPNFPSETESDTISAFGFLFSETGKHFLSSCIKPDSLEAPDPLTSQ